MAEYSKLKYALLLVAQVLLLASAAFCIYFRATILGALAIFGVLALVRSSRRLRFPALRRSKPPFSIKSWQWQVGIALLVVLVAAIAWLFQDAATGYKGVVPVYFFAAAGTLCSLWWIEIFARWFKWWF